MGQTHGKKTSIHGKREYTLLGVWYTLPRLDSLKKKYLAITLQNYGNSQASKPTHVPSFTFKLGKICSF